MRIALINVWSVINSKGGAEKVFSDMSNYLAKLGHDVYAVCCDAEKGVPGFAFDKKVHFINAEDTGFSIKLLHRLCNIRSVFCKKSIRKRRRMELMIPCFAYKLQKIIEQISPDIVISFQLETTYALKSMHGSNLKIVTMLHSRPDFYELLNDFDKHCDQGEVIQVLMPEYKETVQGKTSNARVEHIPNIVPQFSFSAKMSEHRIVNVGRIDKGKRQHMLVEAFALVSDKHPDWVVELYGETDRDHGYTQKVRDTISKYGLAGRVRLMGTDENIPERLKDASIFAFPSEREGFPLALGEAMSVGLATVGCLEASGVNSLIKNGENGILCDGTPEKLSEALDKLMSNEDLRANLGRQAKTDMQQYSADAVMGRWLNLIEEIVAKN